MCRIRPLLSLALVALALGASLRAAAGDDAAARPRLSVPYTQFTLPNGLRVVLHEDHSVPVVAVNVWYHVGSGREKPGRTGFAHLFEHLMFEGSGHVKEGDFDNLLEGAGGDNNGSTNTRSHQLLPQRAVERAGTGAVSRVRSDGLSARGDVARQSRWPARRGQERAAAGRREPAVRAGLHHAQRDALSRRPSVSLADDRLHGRPDRRVVRGRDGFLQAVLRAQQRDARRCRRHRPCEDACAGRAMVLRRQAGACTWLRCRCRPCS